MTKIPYNYRALQGSHIPLESGVRHLGPSNQHQVIKTYVHLRRRLDHAPIPHFDEFIGCPPRKRFADAEFIAKWGADESDVQKMHQFCREHGTKVVSDNHHSSRFFAIEGTIAQFNQMFAIEVHDYEKNHETLGKVSFRSHGQIHLPDHIHPAVISVSNISTETFYTPMVKNTPLPPGQQYPPVFVDLAPSQVKDIYNCPTTSATSQAIAIFSPSSFGPVDPNDLVIYCNHYGIPLPRLLSVVYNGTLGPAGNTTTLGETALDICLAAGYGNGADIVVYYSTGDWAVVMSRIVHPLAGDPVCSTFSTSWGTGIDTAFSATQLSSFTSVLEDGALLGVTFFAPSGDAGTFNSFSTTPPFLIRVNNWYINPWVTGVGGTALGCASGTASNSNYLEWVWNDSSTTHPTTGGGTGGGISVVYPKPSYQDDANIPVSLANGFVGRGGPDITGSSLNLLIAYAGELQTVGGTSGTSPMYAAIFAVINAALGRNVGFINPTLYAIKNNIYNAVAINSAGQTFTDPEGNIWGLVSSPSSGNQISINGVVEAGTANVVYIIFYQPSHTFWQANSAGSWYTKTSTTGTWVGPVPYPLTNLCCIRDIDGTTGGPQDNGGPGGLEGYPVGKGWDACSGWGVINGTSLVNYLKTSKVIPAANEVFIQVKAVNSIGESASSSAFGPFIADANPVGSIPPEPVSSSVTAVSNGVNQLTISWKAASYGTPPITYDIYATKDASSALVKMANTSALTITITFTASTLLPGSSVYLIVNSVDGNGTGAPGSFFNGPFTIRTS